MDYYEELHGKKRISNGLLAFNGVLVLLIIVIFFAIYSERNKPKEVAIVETEQIASPFDTVKVGAKAAYVYDLKENKVLYKKNEFAQLPLASLTKLMMALTASELIPQDSKITIRREFLQEDGDSGLLVDESWNLRDLLDFSLVVSSNDGARSIASVIGAFGLPEQDYDLGRKAFINKMNVKAKELGLKQTYFVNESGLDIDGVSGGYGSAIDIAKLLSYMVENNMDVLEPTKYEHISVASGSKTHNGTNTNIDVGEIPGLLASKTGFTDMAGGNLAIAFDTSIGHPIIAVVLGSTIEGRFTDVKTLVDASLLYTQTTGQDAGIASTTISE